MEQRRKPDTSRPFYSEFAWAFNLLIDRPVQKECQAIAAWLVERGVVPGASVLDAGCGTGRYAIESAGVVTPSAASIGPSNSSKRRSALWAWSHPRCLLPWETSWRCRSLNATRFSVGGCSRTVDEDERSLAFASLAARFAEAEFWCWMYANGTPPPLASLGSRSFESRWILPEAN